MAVSDTGNDREDVYGPANAWRDNGYDEVRFWDLMDGMYDGDVQREIAVEIGIQQDITREIEASAARLAPFLGME